MEAILILELKIKSDRRRRPGLIDPANGSVQQDGDPDNFIVDPL